MIAKIYAKRHNSRTNENTYFCLGNAVLHFDRKISASTYDRLKRIARTIPCKHCEYVVMVTADGLTARYNGGVPCPYPYVIFE